VPRPFGVDLDELDTAEVVPAGQHATVVVDVEGAPGAQVVEPLDHGGDVGRHASNLVGRGT
jgi:hypothetical protein